MRNSHAALRKALVDAERLDFIESARWWIARTPLRMPVDRQETVRGNYGIDDPELARRLDATDLECSRHLWVISSEFCDGGPVGAI